MLRKSHHIIGCSVPRERVPKIFSVVTGTLLLVASIFSFPNIAAAQATQPSCQFILGFKTLHDLAPQEIGDCVDKQTFATNGDAQQHTSKGLMVWRKSDNWTAFTNGYMTWINGPDGLVSRLNTNRFPWENDLSSASPAASTAPASLPVSGRWLLENNQAVYNIQEEDDGYVVMYTEKMRMCTSDGQSIIPSNVNANTVKSPMNLVFTGTMSGNVITGYWLVCATINQSWVPMSIQFTLSPDGSKLTGQLQETLTLDRM